MAHRTPPEVAPGSEVPGQEQKEPRRPAVQPLFQRSTFRALEDGRIGRVIGGRYRLLSKLTSGAVGEVYRTERVGLGRGVAVKFLRAPALLLFRTFDASLSTIPAPPAAHVLSRFGHACTNHSERAYAPYLTRATLAQAPRPKEPGRQANYCLRQLSAENASSSLPVGRLGEPAATPWDSP